MAKQVRGEWSEAPPQGVAVMRTDGTRVELEVRRGEVPGLWIASPSGGEAIVLETGDVLSIDVLPGYQSVECRDVHPREPSELVVTHVE